MGRLIDADKLKEWIEDNNWVLFDDTTVQHIEHCIDSQPTAFDVDKVINQLSSRRYDDEFNKIANTSYYKGFCEGLNEAMRISKEAVKDE